MSDKLLRVVKDDVVEVMTSLFDLVVKNKNVIADDMMYTLCLNIDHLLCTCFEMEVAEVEYPKGQKIPLYTFSCMTSGFFLDSPYYCMRLENDSLLFHPADLEEEGTENE